MTRNNREILTGLREAKEKNPRLAEVVDLQLDLIAAQTQIEVARKQPQTSAQEVRQRFALGVPLLRAQDLALDWGAFAMLFRTICGIAARHRPDLAAQFEGLVAMADQDPAKLRSSTMSYLDIGHLGPEDERSAERRELMAFVLNHTLRPFLKASADAFASEIEQERWQRGRCPVCGGEPDLAFLEQESGARWLVCARCDSEWLFPRFGCPFCNTNEPDNLAYYASKDEQYRLYVCSKCQRYLKTIDLREMKRQVIFPVERITTVALDVAAREKGYR